MEKESACRRLELGRKRRYGSFQLLNHVWVGEKSAIFVKTSYTWAPSREYFVIKRYTNLRSTQSSTLHRHATPDTTQTWLFLFCRVWCVSVWTESARQHDNCVLSRSVSGGAVRPPDALRCRTHLSGGQFTPPHQTRQDCRAFLSTAAATQARQAATPNCPTAHTQRRCTLAKCNTLWTVAYD